MRVERFAPSPTGLLHQGHAYSAALGWIAARHTGGQFLLRMEDLDTARCRVPFYDAIECDLEWLGLSWDGEVLRQSARQDAYDAALSRLSGLGLLYPCICTRKDLRDVVSAPQETKDGEPPAYPGTCKGRCIAKDQPCATRLNMTACIDHLGGMTAVSKLKFETTHLSGDKGEVEISADHLLHRFGDVVLRRKDGAPAYHLAVVVDDAHQGVTHVTRGEDLRDVTAIHRVLQAVLGLPTPKYHHHALIRDETGKRLAKRDDARSIQSLRRAGMAPADIFESVGLSDLVAEFFS